MKKTLKKWVVLLLCCVSVVTGIFGGSVTVKAQESEWNFGYTAGKQEFVVPYTGIYQLKALGAQGGNAGFAGGKGGSVTVTLSLKRGDKVFINVGGQDGYNGGGTGTVSNGGGATDIYINEVKIVVAGGGGGGNAGFEGGPGGSENAGTNETGEGMDSLEGAGGGAGYHGGEAGVQHIVEHVHEGDEKAGGKCYTPVYHKHIGSSSKGGGCYTVPVYHNHNGDCYKGSYWCVWGTPYLAGGTPQAWVAKCECGAESVSSMASGCSTGNHKYHKGTLVCTKSETSTIESYSIGCGKSTNTIVGYEFSCDKVYDEYEVSQAEGGSNWYDAAFCTNVVSEAGIQEGNGMCSLKMLSVSNLFYENLACRSIYYGETKVKKVYYDDILIYKE